MSRRAETETLALLREIRDLVQVLVLREVQSPQFTVEDKPARKLFSWASIHKSCERPPEP
ncbi:hypothetical protein [Candidatus Nitrospira bockiana]